MTALYRKLLLGFFLLHTLSGLQAQKFYFKKYTVNNGLGSLIVNNIYQDTTGYIWFATQGGATRYNGKEFINFTKNDGLLSNDVMFITGDRRGNIWLGTSDGVSKFDGNRFTNYPQDYGVYAIYCDSAGKVWIGLRGGGIKKFNGRQFDTVSGASALQGKEVYAINEGGKGEYWFGVTGGIYRYYDQQLTNLFKTTNNNDSALLSTFFATYKDSRNNIWFGSTSGEIEIINPAGGVKRMLLPDSLRGSYIGSIAADKKGAMWFATDHGLIKYGDGVFQVFDEKAGLASNSLTCVTSDYEDNLWIGNSGAGVNFFKSETFVYYAERDGLANANVNCIVADTVHNQYYIGTEGGGLYTLQAGPNRRIKKVTGISGLERARVSSIAISRQGDIWISDMDNRVFVIENTGNGYRLKKKYSKIAGKELTAPVKIIHDRNGNTWIADYGSGVFFISPSTERWFENIPSTNLLSIFEDSRSKIWIASLDTGVIKYDGKKFTCYGKAEGLTDKSVWCIAEDNTGHIYFGTGESGLCIYNGKNFTAYGREQGLAFEKVQALLYDPIGHCMWAGSEKGLAKIKLPAAAGSSNTHIYNDRDGFNALGVNQNAILFDKNGLIWMGSANGLWRYNRQFDAPQSIKPKIELTGVRLPNQKAPWSELTDTVDAQTHLPVHLQLSYKNNHLIFYIQAFTADDVQYQYILEGQDQEWSAPTRNNEINYSNISPGKKYTFKARAINSAGVSSNETAAFTFFIKPPWWSTWWFRILAFMAFVFALITFIKARESILREQNRRLEKTVALRTSEVVHQKQLVEERNKVISEEKERSELLLLNILPQEVAEELKQNGESEAKLYESVTVMLTDFKEFTKISERLTAQELVHELHVCFSAFDRILEKYGIEKIKTIGDGYLAVSGLPTPNANHAYSMVLAALDINAFMQSRSELMGDLTFKVRIGLHSGPVVAGIVGIKKYAYDIWGDTVNVAARMEQSGAPGRVNISQATYELVKHEFTCEYRGEIEAKNKGKMKMYFVNA